MGTRRILRALGLAMVSVTTALALVLSACSKEPEKAPAPASPPAAQKPGNAPARAAELPVVPPENAITVWDEKSFDDKLLRDPFKPFIKIIAKPKDPKYKPVTFVPKTPLQRFAIEELRFVGVVWSPAKTPEALIEDPKGKGYRVGVGTMVGNRGQKIVKIETTQVTVEERAIDVLGEENIKLITLVLHKPDSEVNQ